MSLVRTRRLHGKANLRIISKLGLNRLQVFNYRAEKSPLGPKQKRGAKNISVTETKTLFLSLTLNLRRQDGPLATAFFIHSIQHMQKKKKSFMMRRKVIFLKRGCFPPFFFRLFVCSVSWRLTRSVWDQHAGHPEIRDIRF